MSIMSPTPHGVCQLRPPRGIAPDEARDALSFRTARALRTPDFDIDGVDRCARFLDGSETPFTAHQWQLLQLLIHATPEPIARTVLALAVCGDKQVDSLRRVHVLTRQLRRKLEPGADAARYVICVGEDALAFDPSGGRTHPDPRHPSTRNAAR